MFPVISSFTQYEKNERHIVPPYRLSAASRFVCAIKESQDSRLSAACHVRNEKYYDRGKRSNERGAEKSEPKYLHLPGSAAFNGYSATACMDKWENVCSACNGRSIPGGDE